jgi:homoserine O-succinyltransferase/O-acetyltransferase
MPVTLEPRRTGAEPPRPSPGPAAPAAVARIGLINNMPDGALQSTEAQFCRLLEAAAGAQAITVRLSSFPELPREAEGLERVRGCYWPIEQLLAEPLDGLIVTGTEPRAPRLRDEPYWARFEQLLAWAQRHTVASIWSCLAAHAAVEALDGIQRQRLPEKRSGIYQHQTLRDQPLLKGTRSPLAMPHSRWNELPLEALRGAGYTVLSWSSVSGADAFVRQGQGSLLLFFQGHPEYEGTTLLKEYRRDVGRYLAGTQANYPTVPVGYLSAGASELLEAFRHEAHLRRDAALMARFPFAQVAAALSNSWESSAAAIYRNWLAVVTGSAAAARAAEPVSWANP